MANTIKVGLEVDTKKGKKKLKEFTKVAKKSADKVEQSFFNLSNALKFGAAILAVRGLVNVFSSAITAANTQEDAVVRMNQALALTGELTAASSKEIEDWASAIERATTTSSDLVLSNFALAQSFTKNKDEAKKLIEAALDFSVGAGLAFEEAVRRIGRASKGSVDDVSKFSAEILDMTKAQLAAGGAADALAKTFKGSAEALATTFGGAVIQTENAMGALNEAFGKAITENKAIAILVTETKKAFEFLTKTMQENKESVRSLVTDGLILFVKTMRLAVVSVDVLQTSFAGLRLATSLVTIGFLKFRKGALESNISTTELLNKTGLYNEQLAVSKDALAAVNIALGENKNKLLDIVAAQRQRTEVLEGLAEKTLEIEERLKAANEEAANAEIEGVKNTETEKTVIKEENLQLRLDNLKTFISAEEQVLLKFAKSQIKDEQTKNQFLAKLTAAENKKALSIFKAKEENKVNFADISAKEQLRLVSDLFGNLASLMQTSNRKLFELGKASAIAQAIVSGILAVQNALASIPFPFNFAAAAAVGVAAGVNIAKLVSAKPPSSAREGITEIPEDNMTFIASKGERILSSETNRDLKDFLSAGKIDTSTTNVINVNFNGDTLGDSEETKEMVANAVADAFEFQNLKREFVGAIS